MSYFVWNTSPTLIGFGPIEIRWYGLFFALAFLLGQGYMGWRLRKDGGKSGLSEVENFLDVLLLYIVLGTLLGARLAHCLIYEPDYYFLRPWEVLMVWRGGLASHGGVAGFLCSLLLFNRRKSIPFLPLLDRLAIPAAFGGTLVRLGNFFNSEIVGRPTDVPWAVVFLRVDTLARHPVQLYESMSYLCIATLLAVADCKGASEKPGRLTAVFLMSVFGARMIWELFKSEQTSWMGGFFLSIGQILSLPLVMIGFYLFFFRKS